MLTEALAVGSGYSHQDRVIRTVRIVLEYLDRILPACGEKSAIGQHHRAELDECFFIPLIAVRIQRPFLSSVRFSTHSLLVLPSEKAGADGELPRRVPGVFLVKVPIVRVGMHRLVMLEERVVCLNPVSHPPVERQQLAERIAAAKLPVPPVPPAILQQTRVRHEHRKRRPLTCLQ